MTKKYILCPGWITSISDGDEHFIRASVLADLYGVRFAECHVWPCEEREKGYDTPHAMSPERFKQLICLHPQRFCQDYDILPTLDDPMVEA